MSKKFVFLWCAPILLMLTSCQTSPTQQSSSAPLAVETTNPNSSNNIPANSKANLTYDKTGMASWYGGPDFHNKTTASGEKFNENALTAAHRTLPISSMVKVTNLANGQSVIVRINDRGPFTKGRIIDLSKRAAHELGLHSTGRVRVQYLKEETQQYLATAHDKAAPKLEANDTDK